MSPERKSVIVFLVLTFSLSTIFWYLLSQPVQTQHHLVVALMWCPGISAIIVRLLSRRGLKGMGWKPGNWKFLLAGFFIAIVYSLIAYVPIWISGIGGFPDPKFVQSVQSKYPEIPAQFSMFVYVIWVGTAAMVPAGFAALGEEIGWRGFLVPELTSITSSKIAGLISGIVWAIWHYPSILFTGYNSGAPILYAISCFTIMVIGLSYIMVWLRLRSGSIWPCVLLHASHNNFIEFFFTPITTNKTFTKYLIDEFGIALAIAIPLTAAVIWIKSDQRSVASSAKLG